MKYIKVSILGLLLFCSQGWGAELRLYCFSGYTAGSPACSALHVYTTNSFNEMTITWNNRPPLIDFLADFSSATWGMWYTFSSTELDAHVDSCANANIPICFATRCSLWLWPGSIVWWYHSKETNLAFAPQLIYNAVTYTPDEDARVDEYNPNTNFGTDSLWNCDNNTPMRQISYLQFSVPVSVEESGKSSIIFKSSPNPFYYSTSIYYTVLPSEAREKVVLSVYDVSGKLVKNLVDRIESTGEHRILWSGEEATGDRVPAGAYFFRLTIGNRTLTTKAMYLH